MCNSGSRQRQHITSPSKSCMLDSPNSTVMWLTDYRACEYRSQCFSLLLTHYSRYMVGGAWLCYPLLFG